MLNIPGREKNKDRQQKKGMKEQITKVHIRLCTNLRYEITFQVGQLWCIMHRF